MKKVVLLGASLCSSNKGVNALTKGTLELLSSHFSNIEILIYSMGKVQETGIFVDRFGKKWSLSEYQLLTEENDAYILILQGLLAMVGINVPLNKRLEEVFHMIKSADLVLDISEGDSFSDIYGLRRFVYHSVYKLICISNRAPLILLPQTIGPFNRKYVKVIANYILKKTTAIFTRDIGSFEYICSNCDTATQEKTTNLNDMAFLMRPLAPLNGPHFTQFTIGININALLYHCGYSKRTAFQFPCSYKESVKTIIEYILSNTNANVILIPHVIAKDNPTEDDLYVCREIQKLYYQKYRSRVICLENDFKEDELKFIISQCDVFIGARMHSCIAALSTATPVVAMAYSRKFNGIWNQFQLSEYMIDLKKDTLSTQIEILKKTIREKNIYRQKLKELNLHISYESLVNSISAIIGNE